MTIINTIEAARPVPVMLSGGKVTAGFRSALFAAANRAGVSVNEFVLRAAGEKLTKAGMSIPGVFERGDLAEGA